MKTIKIKDLNEYGKLVDNLAEQIKKSGKVYNGEPCSHKGCASHVSHPCEGCGRQWTIHYHYTSIKYKAVYSPDNPMLAFLLSKKLGIALWLEFPIQYSFKKEVIVVSDIISTGKTREQYKDYDFACLYFNTKGGRLTEPNYLHSISTRVKTYWLKTIDNEGTKVIMPWEKEIKQ